VFDELFLKAYPLARRMLRARSLSALRVLSTSGIDREDLEQEVVTALWLRLGRFDPLRASLPTFVDRVIATQTTSLLRKGMAQKRLPVNSEDLNSGPVHFRITLELRVDVRRAFTKLSRADEKVARLLLEYKPAEIARKLRWSRAAVYRSMHRIRSILVALGFGKK
jgi:RNA polymerase sigma factor (sigma-70 family)